MVTYIRSSSCLWVASAMILFFFHLPQNLFAECIEYQIIDHGDSVEAVCVGKPLTDGEKKLKEKQDAIQNARQVSLNNKAKLQQDIDICRSQNRFGCKDLEWQQSVDQAIEIGSRGNSAGSTPPFDNSAALAGQLQTQQDQIQRQQAEIQRMQQQQKFNQIWKK